MVSKLRIIWKQTVDEGRLSAKIASVSKLLVAQGKRLDLVEQTRQAERRSFATTQIESMEAKRSLDVQAVEEEGVAALEQGKSRRSTRDTGAFPYNP